VASFKNRDVLSILDLSRKDIECIFATADKLEYLVTKRKRNTILKDKILGSLFFQSSTRTRLSFESAMQRLGGTVIGWAEAKQSRAGDSYQETLADTARVVQSYADVIAMRHPNNGAPEEFAKWAEIPVINGGDGTNEHPTQALLDLYTIKKDKGRIDGLKVLMIGDMVTERVLHSLPYALAKFEDTSVYSLAPKGLRMPKEYRDEFRKLNLHYEEVESMEDVIKDVDVIYSCTVVHNRHDITKEPYRVTLKKLKSARSDVIVLNPLPRLDELAEDVDDTPYQRYFHQPLNGVIIRMALFALVLGAKV